VHAYSGDDCFDHPGISPKVNGERPWILFKNINAVPAYRPWNKGKLVGPKPPLQPKHVWAIRTRLQMQRKVRDLALFNLAIDSKLRGCDVVSLKVEDIAPHGYATERATVRQKKTGRWEQEHLIGSDIPASAFVDFWVRLATLFKGNQDVIFGLMNEPHGIEAAEWLAIVNPVIAVCAKRML
jgi:Cellulase (glycosyl hydrolase family 5)